MTVSEFVAMLKSIFDVFPVLNLVGVFLGFSIAYWVTAIAIALVLPVDPDIYIPPSEPSEKLKNEDKYPFNSLEPYEPLPDWFDSGEKPKRVFLSEDGELLEDFE